MEPAEEEEIRRKFGIPLSHDPQFTGPLKNRSCTDILCLLLFIAFIGGWAVVASFAYKHGDPERLIFPTDSLGQRCGVDSAVKDKTFLFFFDITRCAHSAVLVTGCPTPQVCVKQCPSEDFSMHYYMVQPNADIKKLRSQLICKYDVDVSKVSSTKEAQKLVDENKCAPWYIHSQALAGRCLPKTLLQTGDGMVNLVINGGNYADDNIPGANIKNATKFLATLTDAQQAGEMILQDLASSWHLILAGLFEAMVLCLIYIIIMRWLAAPMVWISVIGSVTLLGYCVYACYERYTSLDATYASTGLDPSISDLFSGNLKAYLAVKETWLVLMIICLVVLIVILLIAIFLRNRLRMAIALIREASKAVGSLTSTLFFPIVPWLLQLAVLAFGVSVMLYLASSGMPFYRVSGLNGTETLAADDCRCVGGLVTYTDGMECTTEEFDKQCKTSAGGKCVRAACSFFAYRNHAYVGWLHFYNLLGLFWGMFFMSAFGEMVLAGTFATWYWTFRKVDLPYFTLTKALMRTIRYHLGTLAFGSLIITICRMIRLFLEYLDKKLKKYDNGFVKAILCCMKCCFWCLEKFLRFLNRNAYIMCAVHGGNFCKSAKDAFSLLMRNVVRVVVLDKVTDFLLFLGKLLIVAAMCAQWFYIMSSKFSSQMAVPALNYYMLPVIIIAVGSYFIASIFFGVYNMAVDTLFLCFLEDCERNDGSTEKPYFMSQKLMRILGKRNKLEKLE